MHMCGGMIAWEEESQRRKLYALTDRRTTIFLESIQTLDYLG